MDLTPRSGPHLHGVALTFMEWGEPPWSGPHLHGVDLTCMEWTSPAWEWTSPVWSGPHLLEWNLTSTEWTFASAEWSPPRIGPNPREVEPLPPRSSPRYSNIPWRRKSPSSTDSGLRSEI